jgi:peptidoglycan hydrolase-like protein with peptidoglycan-binding domain
MRNRDSPEGRWFSQVGIFAAAVGALGCRPDPPPVSVDEAAWQRRLADALHLVLSADREVYTSQVVNRLQNQEKVINASEHWADDKALPLPAQMFRMGAEQVRAKTKSFTYALVSLSPINKQNRPRTEVESRGLTALAESPGQNYYAEEVLARARYLTAIYPDRAVSEACVTCHNDHPDSPRRDFELGDVMGGIVIRVARP